MTFDELVSELRTLLKRSDSLSYAKRLYALETIATEVYGARLLLQRPEPVGYESIVGKLESEASEANDRALYPWLFRD